MTISSPFLHQNSNTSRLMLHVLIALVPGTICLWYFFGWGIVVNITLAIAFALIFESLVLWLRKKPLAPYLGDFSAIVTAWLFAICIPPHSPWWLIATAIGFAMIAGKHLYGGLGFNPFNPAMVGYVVVLISFPLEMTRWIEPVTLSDHQLGIIDSFRLSLGILQPVILDAVSAATPLDQSRTLLGQQLPLDSLFQSPLFGSIAGQGWEWISLAWLMGGLYLLATKTIRWHIPVSLLLGFTFFALLISVLSPQQSAPIGFHLFSGGLMVGAFFIATDPVTAATTPKGRLIYGFSIGVLIMVIRQWGGYPDAIAFAVLLANMCVPLIDQYTQPRVFGKKDD